jgi:DNA sulfur modification protein DndD
MIIESLTLCDFAVFRGEHTIDLSPRRKYDKKRPIILFGGLNGAGKTTILNAIRLGLYGKQALGRTVSQKAYENYLQESIHKSPNSLVKPDSASILLEFTYSKLGELIHYKVIRSWTTDQKQVKETLRIFRNREPVSEITYDQCQSFLNELIPLGVSDLFFFDGERIAQLAEEEGNAVLGDAIRRLLGLDLIERLSSDLNIYVRRQRTTNLPETIQEQLRDYEAKYRSLYDTISTERSALAEFANEIARHGDQLAKLEDTLASKGGAWATDHNALKARQTELERKRTEIEDEIREQLADLYPLSLAPELLKEVGEQLTKESAVKQWRVASKVTKEGFPRLKKALHKVVPKTYHRDINDALAVALADLITSPVHFADRSIVHDLGDNETRQLQIWIDNALSKSKTQMRVCLDRLEAIERELAEVSLQLERVPDSDTIFEDLDAVKQEQMVLARLEEARKTRLEQIRKCTWEALELTRRMRKLESQIQGAEKSRSSVVLAQRNRELLKDFAEVIKNRKIDQLEREFEKSFARLARKEDMLLRASIDPQTFDVTLIGKNEKLIEKRQLSAGEKQVYAIAMLEALACTSARRLPLIIDTPLGRLDSHHRAKLIDRYFPRASHQVILLSTDTEVNNLFYDRLGPNISHAYQILYDEEQGSSSMEEGYFWKYEEKLSANVS